MGEPRIIAGEGVDREKMTAFRAIIQAQILGGLANIKLPAMKRKDSGPFNKNKEIERRRKQKERMMNNENQ